jgi:formylglycine-generating enzyme required for sulfatase activity
MRSSSSSPVLTFEKVLRAYGTGGFTYTDLVAQLERLLAVGASPAAMLEILRRRERIEPFPEYAHVEVVRLLSAAIARDAAEAAASAEQRDPDNGDQSSDSAGAPAGSGVGTEDPSNSIPTLTLIRNQGSSIAAANPLASPEPIRPVEQQVARQLAEYEMLTRSYERLKETESAATARVAALSAEFAAVRGMLELEQSKRHDLERALAESTKSYDSTRSHGEEAARESKRYQIEMGALRDTLAARDAAIIRLMNSLAERDGQLAALQQEHARIVPVLETRAKGSAQLEADAQAAQARSSALTAELAAVRSALQSEQSKCRDRSKALAENAAQLEALQQEHARLLPMLEARTKTGTQLAAELNAARSDMNAMKAKLNSNLELLRSWEWRRGFDQNMLREMDARLKGAEAGHFAPPERDANQAQAGTMRTAANIAVSVLEIPRATPVARSVADAETRGLRTAESPAGKRSAWTPRSLALLVSFAVVVLAVAAWFLAQRILAPKQALTRASVVAPAPGTVIRDCPTCPSMVVLPAGRFKQGSSRAEGGSSFEMPAHWVIIGRPLGMSLNVVTVQEFQQFIAATGRDMQGCDTYDGEWKSRPDSSWKSPGFAQTGTHPVTCVSWDDAQAYARWLSGKTGHQFRLPSASEWEYAARSGGEAVLPWGANAAAACANANVADASAAQRYPGWTVFACNDGYVYTAPVGSFKANSFGLNDMLGNVFQWTEDCWHADYAGAPIDGSALNTGDCSEHELRGGSWFSTPAYVRANYRNHFAAGYRTSSAGIRLVKDIGS